MVERAPIQDVNIELGDDVSRMLYEASQLTHGNRPGLLTEFHTSFSGLRAIPGSYFKHPEDLFFNMGFDGVGTKVEVSERMADHSAVAFDLFAMVCDDAVVRGAEPLAIGSILDVRQLDDTDETRRAVRQLAEGYVAAAKAAGVVVVNGEVAELGDRVGGYGNFNYNWGAAILWAAHKDRILTGHELRAGDTLVGLKEHGFRSNGITDVRRALLDAYGDDWQHTVVPSLGDTALGRLVQRPSTIYSRFVNELTGGFDRNKTPTAIINGVAHITGGGQPSKLGRMLEPSGLGAAIDNPIDPPAIMLHVQNLRELSDKQAYGKWHMGPGMVVVTPEPAAVLRQAEEFGIDAQAIGSVTEESGIRIRNRGAVGQEEWVQFA